MAVGLVTGVLFAWGFGLLTERRLRTHGPELLDMTRTGRRPASAFGSVAMPEMSGRDKTTSMLCWSFGAIPLVPQGIVAGVRAPPEGGRKPGSPRAREAGSPEARKAGSGWEEGV